MNIDRVDLLLGSIVLTVCVIIRLLCLIKLARVFFCYIGLIGVEIFGFLGGWWLFSWGSHHAHSQGAGLCFLFLGIAVYIIGFAIAESIRRSNPVGLDSLFEPDPLPPIQTGKE